MKEEFSLESPHSPSGFHSPEWSTPPNVFRDLDAEFHFTLDACASAENAKCLRFFDAETNSMKQDWGSETVWCNPPYGRGKIDAFVKKAFEASRGGRWSLCFCRSAPARHGFTITA